MLTNPELVMSEKGQRIIKAISDYQKLKGIFTEFKEGFEEKYRDECLINQSSNDTVIQFSTPFDSIALIRFSMVYAFDKTAFGQILFEKLADDRGMEERNEPIWELYFDGERNLKERIADNEPLDYLLTKGNCEHLLADLLDRLLQSPCFKAENEFPED
jgi:hypothetical protein